ncbi:MAG: hypothetical protein E7510_14110 [Ruminococcus sp.]|nr:hypothetical protein [Ruminococcus sp.]
MRKVRIEWSYPMDINNIIYDERMSDIGLYYITRNFGGHITDLYIGKTTYNFHSRLESHIKNWLGDHRGLIQVRLGYIVYPQNITRQYRKELIDSAEKTLIYFMRDKLKHNKQCMKDCYPKYWLDIYNTRYIGNLSPRLHFNHEEWYGW